MTSATTDMLMTSESASQPQLVIWGTNINMHKVKIKFQEFIKIYLLHDEQEQKEFANEGIFFFYILVLNNRKYFFILFKFL